MTQITEYKPSEEGDSESDVRSCPKKNYNHIAYFLSGHGVLLNRENWIFHIAQDLLEVVLFIYLVLFIYFLFTFNEFPYRNNQIFLKLI
jgi:hypothetical protein